MVNRSIPYDNFRGGEWGLLGGEKAPQGSFHGKNVIVYSDGLVGPRPGLKNVTPDGMPEGLLRALVETPVPDRELVFVQANDVYYSSLRDFTINPVLFTGDALTGYGYAIYPKPDTADFLVAIPDVVAGDGSGGVYRLDPAAATVTKLADSPPAQELELYGAQLITTDQRNDGPRLFGSTPGDFEDWPSTYFIDIGDNWGCVALRKQGNFLVIFKRNSIHVMSGVFGEDNMVVRDILSTENGVVHKPWHVDVDADGIIWFIPLFRSNIAAFSGARVTQYGHLNGLFPRVNEDDELNLKRGIACFEGQLDASSIIAVQGFNTDLGIVRHNGIWTYHHFEATITGMVRGFGDHYIITDAGDSGVAAKIYQGIMNLDRPAFTNDPRSSPGDGSDTPLETELTLPVWLDREGNEVRVRSVTVEIKKWDTGVETNSLDCSVKTVNRPNGAGDVTNELRSWSEAATSATTDGVHDRIVFPMHCAVGQGFQLTLSNLVGVAIKSVTVDLEDFKEQPRKK